MRGSDINMELTFAAEVDRVNGMEQRVSEAKTPEAKDKLRREREKAKEDVIEEIAQAYNIDQFEAADKFDGVIPFTTEFRHRNLHFACNISCC